MWRYKVDTNDTSYGASMFRMNHYYEWNIENVYTEDTSDTCLLTEFGESDSRCLKLSCVSRLTIFC